MINPATPAMKELLLLTLAATLATIGRSAPAVHVVVSPWSSIAERTREQEALRTFALKQAPGGTRLKLWDGWSRELLASGTVPELRYDAPAARAQQPALAAWLRALKTWAGTPPPADARLANSAALRPPEIADELTPELVGGPAVVVLLGSPLHLSIEEPDFAMTEGRYPSDGHLRCTTAESAYGVAGRSGRLAASTLHWVVPAPAPWVNPAHEAAVRRFWCLYFQSQGGVLASFGTDLPRLLHRALENGLGPVVTATPDPADDKPVMRSALPRHLPAWIEPVAVAPTPPATVMESPPAPALLPAMAPVVAPAAIVPAPAPVAAVPPRAPRPEPVAPKPEPVVVPFLTDPSKSGVGIAWSARGVDLDLYAQLKPGARELCYRRETTPEGFLYRDELNANQGGFFEFVEFKEPADLSRLRLWVNYYRGNTANVTGQIVVFDHGRVRTGTFRLAASSGNRGGAQDARATSPHWVEIVVDRLVNGKVTLAAKRPERR